MQQWGLKLVMITYSAAFNCGTAISACDLGKQWYPVTIISARLGFLSPPRRGGLRRSTMLLFTFMGILAGYTSARFYILFNGTLDSDNSADCVPLPQS